MKNYGTTPFTFLIAPHAGIFGKVEHVFLLGVAGGIVNYQDDRTHVRLGDVVVSKPESPGGPMYINCTGVRRDPSGGAKFDTQSWGAQR